MAHDPNQPPPRSPTPDSADGDADSSPASSSPTTLIDAVYEVALEPARYDELVAQWHQELTSAAGSDSAASGAKDADPLAEHFQQATVILERVHAKDWQPRHPPSAAPMPELVLSVNGNVLSANPGAAALLSAQPGLELGDLDLTLSARESLLDVFSELDAERLSQPPRTTQSSDSHPPQREPRVLRLNRDGDDRPLVVLLSATDQGADPDTAILMRCAEIVWPESLAPLLITAFELTPAECDIVKELVAGFSAAAIAEHRGTSRETVRTQIRELLAKTGTHSQLELIRMAIGFSMMAQQAEARTGQLPGPENTAKPGALLRSSVSEVSQGRRLQIVEYGPSDGNPVLVFHDEVIGDAFVLPLMRQAPDCRWIVIVRYGYGESSLLQGVPATRSWQQLNRDLARVLPDHLPQGARMPLLAQGNGAYFACRYAAANPGHCRSVTTLASSLPGNIDDKTLADSRYASFVRGMGRIAPAMLRFATQAGFAMYARVGTARFLQRVYGDAAPDAAVINNANHLADLDHGGRLTLAQGYRGFLADEEALVEDWSEEMLNAPVPVRILLGEYDTPLRQARAERLHNRSNNIELTTIPDAGFFAAFTAPEQVTAALLSA